MEIIKNSYLVNNFRNTVTSFIYHEDREILCRFFQNSEWSRFTMIANDCKKLFSVVHLSEERLGLIYQDYEDNILINVYDGYSWYNHNLINNNESKIYTDLKAVAIEQKIYLFFNLFDENLNTTSLYYNVIDSKFNILSANQISYVKGNASIPYKVSYCYDDSTVYIIYEQSKEGFTLGYKTLPILINELSQFYCIDNSSIPFLDFSCLVSKNIFHTVYIKKDEEKNNVIYSQGSGNDFSYIALAKGIGITNCSILILNHFINCSFIKDQAIFSILLSDDGQKLTDIAYPEEINSENIIKCTYVTSKSKLSNEIILNEFFAQSGLPFYYPAFINELIPFKSSYLANYLLYYIENTLCKLRQSNELSNKLEQESAAIADKEKKIEELTNLLEHAKSYAEDNNKKITELEDFIKRNEAAAKVNKNRLENILNAFNKFQENKQLLREGIQELQVSILEKDIKIKMLQNEVASLNDLVDKLNNKESNSNTDMS